MPWSTAQTAALAALVRWRDGVARRLDESCGYVLPKAAMIRVAQALPSDATALLHLLQQHPVAAAEAVTVLGLLREAVQEGGGGTDQQEVPREDASALVETPSVVPLVNDGPQATTGPLAAAPVVPSAVPAQPAVPTLQPRAVKPVAVKPLAVKPVAVKTLQPRVVNPPMATRVPVPSQATPNSDLLANIRASMVLPVAPAATPSATIDQAPSPATHTQHPDTAPDAQQPNPAAPPAPPPPNLQSSLPPSVNERHGRSKPRLSDMDVQAADDESASEEEEAFVPLPSDKAVGGFDYAAFKAQQPGLCLQVGGGAGRAPGGAVGGRGPRTDGRGRGRKGSAQGRTGGNPFEALQRSSPQGPPKRKRGASTKTASFAR